MLKSCSNPNCTAPKGLCNDQMNREFQLCPNWNNENKETKTEKIEGSKVKAEVVPWSGLALRPKEIELLAHRSSPFIIGTIGAPKAGKTSYLGMLYTLLFNGKRFVNWNFAGSITLIAWETLAKYLKIKENGKVDFPEPTPSNPDYYSLYHLALRNDDSLYDVLFADSSGEVFTLWANDTEDVNAENANWIYENSDAFIFFVDCEDIIAGRGRAKRNITQLAGQVSANLGERPVVIVWSKADKIDGIPQNMKDAITESMGHYFPNALTISISNFSKKDPDVLCHKNNLIVTEYLLDYLTTPREIDFFAEMDEISDLFFKYRGSYGSK